MPISRRTAVRTDAPAADSSVTLPVDMSSRQMIGPALVTSHHRLGRHRPVGETRVAVYGSDDPAGFGPALQIVTDFTPMVMDSVTVLLHRFGVSYTAIMNPVFRVRRSPHGELVGRAAARGDVGRIQGGCRRILDSRPARPVGRQQGPHGGSAGGGPSVLSDARQVALDSGAMAAAMRGLAHELDIGPERPIPRP